MRGFAIVQARMGSTRFPGKSMAEIAGRPILWYLFRQLQACRSLERRILATSDQPTDDVLVRYAVSEGWDCFRGSESDVLSRYHGAAVRFGADAETVIVRVTGDDIWPDPWLIDAALALHRSLKGEIAAVFTAENGNLPYGAYVESYTFATLDTAQREATETADREHVSPFIKRARERFPRVELCLSCKLDIPPLSIDTPEDLERNRAIHCALDHEGAAPFTLADLVRVGGTKR